MQRIRKQRLGASLLAAGTLTIVSGFLLDDPATATPAGSAQVSGGSSGTTSTSTSTTETTTTSTTTVESTSTTVAVVGAGGATQGGGAAPAPVQQQELPRTGTRGIDPGILLVLGGGLAVSGVLIVRYAADKP
jgi:hypothetical protein